MGKIQIEIGSKFTRLTVIANAPAKNGHTMYECVCECGVNKLVRGSSLLCKNTLSCGCLNNEMAAELGRSIRTHGKSKTTIYYSYKHMISRCYSRKDEKYKNYGERGIVVCDRWRDSFSNFLQDMGDKPSPSHSIGRIDNDGNYEPSNCRWETTEQQSANKTTTIKLTVNGVQIHQSGLAKKIGVDPHLIKYHRNKGKNGDQIVDYYKNKLYANTI